MSSTLPESAAPKLLDIWMFYHVLVLFLVFIMHVIVNILLEKSNKKQENKKQNKKSPQNDFDKWNLMKKTLELVSSI